MAGTRIVCYDLETGGFYTKDHRYGIAEVAMVSMDSETLEEVDRLHLIIQPYLTYDKTLTQYTPKALEVNGLTMDKIHAGIPAVEAIQLIVAFLKKQAVPGKTGKPYLGGHNIDEFDSPMLDQFFELHKQDLSKLIQTSSFDTLYLSRLIFQGPLTIQLGNGLQHIHSTLGFDSFEAHRALADVEANLDVIREFLMRLRNSSSTSGNSNQRSRNQFKF
jgi:DNA polymerase III alpha subunit (gram-positive type)